MFRIITDRLIIIPLDKEQLELCINAYGEMEKTLGLNNTDTRQSERQKSVCKIRLNGVMDNPIRYMWFTVWIIVHKEENKIIGSAMIKGYPNQKGEVIVGYGVNESYRCKGYATEALKAMINWIFENPNAKIIVADTLKDNIPSHRVLQKLHMKVYKEDSECYWWKIKREEIGME